MLAQIIMQLYASNKFVIDLNARDLSHEDSLLNPLPEGNNLNWVLGHILVGHAEALDHLQIAPLWGLEQQALYASGSDTITPETALPFSHMLVFWNRSQEQLVAALADENVAERLARPCGEDGTVGQRLLGLAWHETYHAGQTDYLRRLAGFLEGGVR